MDDKLLHMTGQYILDENSNPVEEPNYYIWSDWWTFERQRWHLETTVGTRYISTVFLGLDHSHNGGRPVLFETMEFGTDDQDCERTCTWAEAQKMHEEFVSRAKREIGE